MTKTGNDCPNPEESVETPAATDEVSLPLAHPVNHEHVAQDATARDLPAELPPESGGQAGLEPTRYGDWEKKGRCTDF